jgi:KTSC domain
MPLSPLTVNKLLKFKMFSKGQTLSTCVADVEYNSLTREMTVQFVERGTYKYKEVPIDEYVDFEMAASQGTYFNLYIRNRYSYERVE